MCHTGSPGIPWDPCGPSFPSRPGWPISPGAPLAPKIVFRIIFQFLSNEKFNN
jgi:hypothetical protein